MSGPVCVVGATGATGRRVARAVAAVGLPLIVAGRDRARLAALAADVGGAAGPEVRPEVRPVHVDHPSSLDAALDGVAVAVNCVGPFSRFGFPVAEAAVRNGVHYLDTSGEPLFALRLVEELDAAARRARVAVVPAVASSAVPGDVAAALALAGAPDGATALTLAYRISGMRPSRGTVLSEIEISAGGAVIVARGGLARVPAGGPPRLLPGGWGIRMPVPDPVVVSRYCRLPQIEAVFVTRGAVVVGRAMQAGQRLLSRPDLRSALRRLAARLPETDDGRPHGTFAVDATVWGPWGARTTTAEACDVYGFTARAAALVAATLVDGPAASESSGAADGGVRAASQVLSGAADAALGDRVAVEKAAGELGISLSSAAVAPGEPVCGAGGRR